MDLSVLLSSNFSNTTLLSQIGAQIQKNAQLQSQTIGDQYGQQISAVQNSPAAVNATKSQKDISKTVDSLKQAVTSLQQMSDTLDNMSSVVANVGGGTTADMRSLNFDAQWSVLNSLSQSGGSANLLGTVTRGGDYRPSSTSYTAANGSSVTVQGAYLGTDYSIKLNDGSFFMANGTRSLQKYTAYPFGTVGYAKSTAPGSAVLQSATGNPAVQFTLGANLSASSQENYTGTVVRQGLGVLNSWLYNNFSTPSDQAAAQKDISQAKSQVQFMIARFSGMQTMAQNDLATDNNVQATIKQKVADLQDQAQAAMKKVSDDAQRQYNAIQSSMAMSQSASSSTSALTGLFGALAGGSGVSLDALAAGGSAVDATQSPQQQWLTMQQNQAKQAAQAMQNPYGTALSILT